METHRSRGQDESGDGEEPVVACDLRTVDRQWTPDRSSRATNETKKRAIAVPDEELEKEEYFMFEIGGVTSISPDTDSLVFQMELQPDDYHPMRIALSSQSHITLDEDLVSLIKIPSIGSSVIGFGAQRRGAMCLVHDASKSSSGAYSFQGDIGLRSSGPATEASTDGGDCGTIFCSVENGAPLYFHHVLSRLSDDLKLSYGVPFLEVLNAHPETKHLVPAASSGDKEGEPKKKKGKISGSPSAEAHEVSDLRQFQTKVMDRPPTGSNTDSLTVSAQTEGSNASLPLNARGGFKTYDDGVEDKTLPIFNVRKKKYSR